MLTCTKERIETVETLYFEKKILTYSLLRHPSSFNNSKPPLSGTVERRGQDESQTVGCHKTWFTIESETKSDTWKRLSGHWIFNILLVLSWRETWSSYWGYAWGLTGGCHCSSHMALTAQAAGTRADTKTGEIVNCKHGHFLLRGVSCQWVSLNELLKMRTISSIASHYKYLLVSQSAGSMCLQFIDLLEIVKRKVNFALLQSVNTKFLPDTIELSNQ